MKNVTERQQRVDIWTDPDPQPEDVEAWFADPTNEWIEVKVPPNSTRWIEIPDGMSYEEWERRRAEAHARGEKLPEEIAADEELAAAQAAEEKDWSPGQKAVREAERLAAHEALEKLRR